MSGQQDDIADSYSYASEVIARAARHDPGIFLPYVLRDEITGRPVEMSPVHDDWQRMLSENDRMLVWSHIESGKTSQISIGRSIYELGRDQTLRIAIVSNTNGQATKLVRTIAKYIEDSPEVHHVFPELLPDDPWTATQLFVKRKTRSKDPSVQACGIHGNITGARIDLLILDDILDYENCRTEEARADLSNWYNSTLAGRLTARSRVWCVGTAYHPNDQLHHFARTPGWKAVRYPVIQPETGQPRWPERWPMARIEKKRDELGPLEFARQMLCVARDDAESRFKKEWIDACLARGKGLQLMQSCSGLRTYTGVDLAVQRKDASDKTVLFTIIVHADGSRQIANIDAGKWSGPEIVQRIIDTHRRYNSIVFVENNAAQDYILQFTRGSSAVPVRSFTTTGKAKHSVEFGVESIGAEMASGKWIIPCDHSGRTHPEVASWITEMLYYAPDAHTGDRLMASWFAREGARQGTRKVQTGYIDLTSR